MASGDRGFGCLGRREEGVAASSKMNKALRALARHAPTLELRLAARSVKRTKGAAAGRRRRTEAKLVNATRRLPPEYQPPAFRCLYAYKDCIADGINWYLCFGTWIACLAERFVPLAGGGGGKTE